MAAPQLDRRQFLRTATLAAAAFQIVPRHVLGGRGFVPPSEKVNLAVVGVGGMGMVNARRLMQLDDAQIIAIADPAEYLNLDGLNYQREAGRKPARAEIEKHYAEKTPNYRCAEYEDFRLLLEKEKAVDAVLCATPDHLHAYVSITAMRAGKHVYCEKPLTHNLWEARKVLQVARETGVATQMGNQGHSSPGIRETVEFLQDGAIGPVREVHAWVSGGRWNPTLLSRPEETPVPPPGLNWDLWLGPREPRPYHPAYFPVAWRDFWEFGGARIGDFSCHDLDAAVWAFDLATPARVEALPVGPTDREIAPHGCVVYYDFPASQTRPGLRLTWYDGGIRPRAPEALEGFRLPRRGVLFVGEKGAIQCDGAGGAPRLFPASRRSSYVKAQPTLPRSPGHHREWIDACKGGPHAGSHFEYGARLTEIGLLGVLALRTGRPIEWDAEKLEARGLPEATPIIRGAYRQGWELS